MQISGAGTEEPGKFGVKAFETAWLPTATDANLDESTNSQLQINEHRTYYRTSLHVTRMKRPRAGGYKTAYPRCPCAQRSVFNQRGLAK